MRTIVRQLGLLAGLLCISVALTAAWAGEKKNPASTPSPRMGKGGQPDANWMKRHDGFVEIAKKGGVDVLLLGDSITDAWRQKGAKPAWDKLFEPIKSANFGIGGDQTQHVLWRIQNGELDGIKPKLVMLMIGTNNTGGHSAEQIAEGITDIVKTIHQKSPDTKILLLAVFPRANKTGDLNTKIPEINKIIAKLDNGRTVKYLDIGEKLLVDGKMSKDIMPDHLHLSGRGYEIWGAAVTPTIHTMLKN
ncbi:MAG: GDSL-type esterase/lipase family protein [Gemmataceae bacterium]|nr:GDSL-type esterase/lipase family protein [Gemmataceae bacterium]